MKKYKIYMFNFFMAILSLNKSISCEFDSDTYFCFGFSNISNSLVYVNHDQDFPEQEAHATLLRHGPLLTDNINDNKDIIDCFNQLSRDEILSVSVYLNPIELRKLSITCSNLSNTIRNPMWEQYNVIHNYHAWGFSLSSMRISYACFYYQTGKFDIAAKLGHPEAIHQLRKRKEAITLNPYDSYCDRYYDHKNYHYRYYGYFY